MQNGIRLVNLMRILLHLSTYFPNTPRIRSKTKSMYLLHIVIVKTLICLFFNLHLHLAKIE